jgi:putative colanic acid biosynthesis acetyltransferase WcaF
VASISDPIMRLDGYSLGNYTPGAPLWKQLAWYFLGHPLFASYWIPFSGFKVGLLRCFGAQMGTGIRIKPGVRVKFPWRLSLGDYVWVGEDSWFDNLAPITIGNHVCISQGVYLCTGNHDWSDLNFALRVAPITIGDQCWIAAKSTIGPGVNIGTGVVLTMGTVAARSLPEMGIYAGNPVQKIKDRKLKC